MSRRRRLALLSSLLLVVAGAAHFTVPNLPIIVRDLAVMIDDAITP